MYELRLYRLTCKHAFLVVSTVSSKQSKSCCIIFLNFSVILKELGKWNRANLKTRSHAVLFN